jgi:hypothetical protein
MKQGGRSSSSRASFATEPLYNREGASEGERESPKTRESKDSKTRESRDSKTRESRDSRKRKPSQDKEGEKDNKRKPCWICDRPHNPRTCFLALDYMPKRVTIPEENRVIFEKRMRDSAFAKRIQTIREYLKKKDDIFA